MDAKIITWDWRSQIDIEEVNEALAVVPSPRFYVVDTNDDQYAIVIAPAGTRDADAQKFYEEHKHDDN